MNERDEFGPAITETEAFLHSDGTWDGEQCHGTSGYLGVPFIRADLTAERERWYKRQLDQLAHFNPDWDILKATQDALIEHMQLLRESQKREREFAEAVKEYREAATSDFNGYVALVCPNIHTHNRLLKALAAYDEREQPMANEETYTVLLLRPDYQRDGETPWWDTYLWTGRANGADVAVSKAQADATDSSGAQDPDDFAPIFVCFGEPEDITPKKYI